MAKKSTPKEQSITIDGKKYALNDLSDAAKAQVANIRYVEREIEEAKNRLAVLQAARQFYSQTLAKELPSD